MTLIGKKSQVKCKKEAMAPKLLDFVAELRNFELGERKVKYIRIITDDIFIEKEIEKLTSEYMILEPEPAPKRAPDKVSFLPKISFYERFLNCCTEG